MVECALLSDTFSHSKKFFMNERIAKLARKEKRFQFDRDAGFFLEKAFSRPIYGLLWWLWVFVFISFFYLPLGSVTSTEYESDLKAYAVYAITFGFLAAILVIVSRKELRTKWFRKNTNLNKPMVYWIALRAIPVILALCFGFYLTIKL